MLGSKNILKNDCAWKSTNAAPFCGPAAQSTHDVQRGYNAKDARALRLHLDRKPKLPGAQLARPEAERCEHIA